MKPAQTLAPGAVRNLRLYPLYQVLHGAYFWAPVHLLYFLERFELSEVLLLATGFQASVSLLEIPSGYAADVMGRRPTLLLSTGLLAVGYSLILTQEPYQAVLLAHALMGASFAFRSGTDVSLHLESASAAGREGEFVDLEARAQSWRLGGAALAAVVGGALGTRSFRAVYGLSLASALLALVVVGRMVEPPGRTVQESGKAWRPVRPILRELRDPTLLWGLTATLLVACLAQLPHEFYQPYLRYLERVTPAMEGRTALTSGLVAAVTLGVGSLAAGASARLTHRLGAAGTVLLAPLLLLVVVVAMGSFLHPFVLVLVMTREVPGALIKAPWNAVFVPLVPASHRATFLSLVSLGARGAVAVTLLLCSRMSARPSADHATLARVLLACATAGAVAWLALASTRWVVPEVVVSEAPEDRLPEPFLERVG